MFYKKRSKTASNKEIHEIKEKIMDLEEENHKIINKTVRNLKKIEKIITLQSLKANSFETSFKDFRTEQIELQNNLLIILKLSEELKSLLFD